MLLYYTEIATCRELVIRLDFNAMYGENSIKVLFTHRRVQALKSVNSFSAEMCIFLQHMR